MRNNGDGKPPTEGSDVSAERMARKAPQDRSLLRDLIGREFNPHWYVTEYPEAAREIAQGLFADALDHYVQSGLQERRSPNGDFDEAYYLDQYPDVANAVRSGSIASGFQHFLQHGRNENRRARQPPDLTCTVDAVRANFIEGWAANMLDPNEILELEFYLDDRLLIGRVRADKPRQDLLSLLPTVEHGFVFPVPLAFADGIPRQIAIRDARTRELAIREGRGGRQIARVTFSYRYDQGLSTALLATERLDEIAGKLEELRGELEFVKRLASFPLGDYDYYFRHFYEITGQEVDQLRRASEGLAERPLFSVVLPAHESNTAYLEAAIRSVRDQAYPYWELCISDDASRNEGVREVVRAHARADARIKFVFSKQNGGIAKNTNRAIELAAGDYVAFLDHDDVLTPDALYVMALALQGRKYDVVYSDEDTIDEFGKYLRPHFKPDFNYDYCLAVNYLCHLLVVDRRWLDRIGGLEEGFDACQDRALVLRAVETCERRRIRHVARVLYHWRVNSSSVSNTRQNRDVIMRRTVECVQAHFDRIGTRAVATPGEPSLFSCRVRWPLPNDPPLVSLVIPSKDRLDLLGPCLTSILERTTYAHFEVVIVDHDSTEPATRAYFDVVKEDRRVRVERYEGPFNWSALNNFGAAHARGAVLCFLNNDMLVFDPEWLDELVTQTLRKQVGAVGAKLLYDDGTVQHGGVVLGIGGYAGHAFQHTESTDLGYLGRAACAQEVSAVTGACLACRRTVFDEVGGFDAGAFPIALNDVDFCLRLRKKGYTIVWTPHAALYHFESKSRGYDDVNPEKKRRLASEAAALRSRWGEALFQDPNYNPHFDLSGPPYERMVVPKRIWTALDLAARPDLGEGFRRDEGEAPREALDEQQGTAPVQRHSTPVLPRL